MVCGAMVCGAVTEHAATFRPTLRQDIDRGYEEVRSTLSVGNLKRYGTASVSAHHEALNALGWGFQYV